MNRKEIYLNTHGNLKKDPLSDFIKSLDFQPNWFGHQLPNTNNTCDYRVIGDFEIIFVIGGESHITIAKKEYICSRGDIVIIPPFVMHKIQTPKENPHDNYWIHFDVFPFYLQESFSASLMLSEKPIVKMENCEELLLLYQMLEKSVVSGAPGHNILFKTILVQVITFILQTGDSLDLIRQKQMKPSSANIEIINRCTEFIRENVYNSVTIDHLCKNLNISESYIYKSFIKTLNLSPTHFISLYKLKRAEELMKTTDLSIKEISEQLCFSSPYYFSNVFKKFYKMSPKEYIRRMS